MQFFWKTKSRGDIMGEKLIDRTDEWHKQQEALKKPYAGAVYPPKKKEPAKDPVKENS